MSAAGVMGLERCHSYLPYDVVVEPGHDLTGLHGHVKVVVRWARRVAVGRRNDRLGCWLSRSRAQARELHRYGRPRHTACERGRGRNTSEHSDHRVQVESGRRTSGFCENYLGELMQSKYRSSHRRKKRPRCRASGFCALLLH